MPKSEDPHVSSSEPLDPDATKEIEMHVQERQRGFRRRKIDTPLEQQPTFIAVQDVLQQLTEIAKGNSPTYEDVAKIANFSGKREEYDTRQGRRTRKNRTGIHEERLEGPGYEQTFSRTRSASQTDDLLWIPTLEDEHEQFSAHYEAPRVSEKEVIPETVTLMHKQDTTIVVAGIALDTNTQAMLFRVSAFDRDQMWFKHPEPQQDYLYLVQPQQTIDIAAYQQEHGRAQAAQLLGPLAQSPMSS